MNRKEDNVGYQVESIQEEYGEGNPWAVVYGSSPDDVTLIEDALVYNYLISKYSRFECPDLWTKYLTYNSMHVDDFYKALQAWNATYNPLDNYNGTTERITTDTHGDETKTHSTGGSDGLHNKVTTQAVADTYTQHDTTTYDSTSPRMESKDIQHGGTETIDNLHTTDTTSHATVSKTVGDVTATGDIVHTETENKHGNLGVTTTQQMIQSEIDMRLNPLQKQYLDRFIYEYAYYVGGSFVYDRWCLYDD